MIEDREKTLRIRWRKLGGHYHCRIFTGVEGMTFANCGELVFDEDDWKQIMRLFHTAEFIADGDSE
jgi:hypothetical protein